MSFNFEYKGLDDILDAIERLHEWLRLNQESKRQLSNWIDPLNGQGCRINLAMVFSVEKGYRKQLIENPNGTRVESQYGICFNGAAWWITWRDTDKEYKRIMKLLGVEQKK